MNGGTPWLQIDGSLNAEVSTLVQAALGVILLFFGRKLFWLFVAVVGFLVGMQFATMVVPAGQAMMVLLAAVLLGLLGAVLAVLFQRLAILLAAGAAGGLFCMQLALKFGSGEPLSYAAFAVGAMICAVVALVIFDWALIAMSALTGASMIAGAFVAESTAYLLVWAVLVAIGVIVQSRALPARV